MSNTEFEKVYDPSSVEEKWYPIWEGSGAFQPNSDENAETCHQCSVGKITKSWNRRQNRPFWSCSEYSNGCKWTEPYGNSSS